MRQIGDDFSHDPLAPRPTQAIAAPDMNPAMVAYNKAWQTATYMSRAHKYCSGMLDLSSSELGEKEASNITACMSRYHQAFKLFDADNAAYVSMLDKLTESGQNKYDHIN